MLDCHFPDEHVRQFAVSALNKMTDEQLEDILLQLTQVCSPKLISWSERQAVVQALICPLLRALIHIINIFYYYT